MVKTVPFRPVEAEALDLDFHDQFQMLKRLFNAAYMGKKTELRTSPSGRGYHIHCTPPLTQHEAMMLGDCKGRVFYWEFQGYTFTFDSKLNWHGRVVGREKPEDPLSLPFWSLANGHHRRWLEWRKKKRKL